MTRSTWTDSRLDDLNTKVDRGFERVDAQLAQMNESIAGLHRLLVHVVLGIVATLVAGFGSVLGLIAAMQL